MRDIGKNIRDARVRKNMTQDELAEKLYVTRQTVSNYETGKSRPDVEMLTNIAEMLDTELAVLIYGIEQPPQKRRERICLAVSAAIIAACWIAVLIAFPHVKSIAATRYFVSGMYILKLCIIPTLCFALGWLAISACGVFLGAKRPKFFKRREVRIAVYAFFGMLLLLLLPMLVSVIGLAIEEIKILLTDGPNSLSWRLGGDIPIISKLSVKLSLFIYRFPYVMLPLGIFPWLTKKEPQ